MRCQVVVGKLLGENLEVRCNPDTCVEETGSLGMRKSYDRHLFASVIFSWSGQWSAQSALAGFVGADDDDVTSTI